MKHIHTRVFRACLGLALTVPFGAGCRGPAAPAAQAQTRTGSGAIDVSALREHLNADPEFRIDARYWTARLRMEVGDRSYDLTMDHGNVTDVGPSAPVANTADAAKYDVRIAGPLSAWTDHTVAMGMLRGAESGRGERKLAVEGDAVLHVAPYQNAILRIVRLTGEALGVRTEEAVSPDVAREFDSAVGRYVYVNIRGTQYRVYFEEAGHGDLPLILQHTAGADSRQWRHLLEDPDIQKNYRIIAYDLPFHGKSLPPAGQKWWTQEYQMTTPLLVDTVVAISKALKLDRPVFMGCSIGGYLAPDLAYYHPEAFTAVIGVNAAIAGSSVLDRLNGAPPPAAGEDANNHPRVANVGVGALNYMNTSPVAPEASRREMEWIYSQAGPGIYAGDIYYYRQDHDLTGGKAEKIDTSKVEVHFLSGEYDRTAPQGPGSVEVLAKAIKGSTFQIIKGAAHFMISDDYPRFRQYAVPLLDQIHARHARPSTQTASNRTVLPLAGGRR